MSAGNCPICNSLSEIITYGGRASYEFSCRRCGKYTMQSLTKAAIERSLQLDNNEIEQYLTMGGSGYNQQITLFIEVARKAANGRGIDVPRSIISHVLRKREDKRVPLTCDDLANVLKNNSLPAPAELANNFIIYLGRSLSSPGGSFEVPAQQMSPSQENIYGLLGFKVGAIEWKNFHFIIAALDDQKF